MKMTPWVCHGGRLEGEFHKVVFVRHDVHVSEIDVRCRLSAVRICWVQFEASHRCPLRNDDLRLDYF